MEIIFDGIAKENHLVAAGVYLPKDFTNIYGTKKDYKDYLLYRFRELVTIEPPARIIELPFDGDLYNQWLVETQKEDCEENRCLWLLSAANHSDILNYLKMKHPILPKEPHDEEITISVDYLMLLPDNISQNLEYIRNKTIRLCKDIVPGIPALKRLSPIRCHGLTVLIGDSFICTDNVEIFTELNLYMTEIVNKYLLLGTYDGKKDDILFIPQKFKLQPNSPNSFIFLPMVLIGSDIEVQYCRELLDEYADIGNLNMFFNFTSNDKNALFYIPENEIIGFLNHLKNFSNNSRKLGHLSRIK